MGKPGRPIGYVCSEETKSKTSASMEGHYVSKEQKEKTSDSVINYWLSSRSKYHHKKLKDRVGELHFNYKGRYTDAQGYIVVYVGEGRHEYEHRVVAEKMLGRKLKKDEVVHHLDLNKSNNEPENLLVMNNYEHLILHQRLKKNIFKGYDYMGNYVSYEYQMKPIKFKTLKRRTK